MIHSSVLKLIELQVDLINDLDLSSSLFCFKKEGFTGTKLCKNFHINPSLHLLLNIYPFFDVYCTSLG
jgi:hypothetical protein